MTKVLKLADAYANGLMLGSQRNGNLTTFTRAECKSVLGTENPTTPAADRFRGDILAQTLMLARLPRSAERELAAPSFPRAKTRALLIRDPALSAFDPITTFVQAIADVRVQDRLPSMPEAADFDSLIVLSQTPGGANFSVDDLTKLSALKSCFWAVTKSDGTAPANYPVRPRKCPLGAADLAAFVSRSADSAGIAAARHSSESWRSMPVRRPARSRQTHGSRRALVRPASGEGGRRPHRRWLPVGSSPLRYPKWRLPLTGICP